MIIIEPIPDNQTVNLLRQIHKKFPSEKPGITAHAKNGEYVWRDTNGIPRGCLSVWPGGADKFSFVVRVHPEWRRQGIATALYEAAAKNWMLLETEFTELGALWIKSIPGGNE